MGQGEGVEGAGEERHRPGRLEPEAPPEQLLLREEPVQPPQHGGAVVKGELVPLLLLEEGQEPLLGQQEGPALLVDPQHLRAEHMAAQDEQRLLPHLGPEARQSPEEQSQQAFPAAAVGRVSLREADPVGVVFLVDNAHGVQRRGGHPGVGGAQGLLQLAEDLLQLYRRQPQAEPPQIAGDVLGELLLPDLQPPAQLHRHLVALLRREQRGHGQQRGPRRVADRDPVADLHQVGEVGSDVEQAPVSLPGQPGEQPDVDLLEDPRRGGLQVVQEYLGHRLPGQGGGLAPSGDLPHGLLPQQRQGGTAGAVHLPQGPQQHVLGGDGRTEIIQQQNRRRAHRHILPGGQRLGEEEKVIPLPVRQDLHRQRRGRLQQLEGSLVLQPLRTAVVPEKFL